MPHFNNKTWAAITAHEDTKLFAPAKIKAIDAFEIRHAFTFPEAHREFLLRGNGGVVGFARLFGAGRKDSFDLGQRLSEMRPYIEGIPENSILPFANDWGGSYFCYDRRKPPSPQGFPVLYWNHEYSEEPSERPLLWSHFAQDFVAFIKEVIK